MPIFDRLECAIVTCPANTAVTAPLESQFTFPTGIVRHVWIVIPAGHAGLTGIALGYGHTPVVPYSNGGFVSGDDEVLDFDWRDRVPGARWAAFMVNVDAIAHTWQVRFGMDELTPLAGEFASGQISAAAIENAASQLLGGQ